MTSYSVNAWGNDQKVFSWSLSDGLCRIKNPPQSSDGFVKQFLFYKKIVIYKKYEEWFLSWGKCQYSLSDIGKVDFSRNGLIFRLIITVNNSSYYFYEINGFDFISRNLDPTYDSFDSELVFGKWLLDLFHKQNSM